MDKRALLQTIPLFARLSPEQLALLSESMSTQQFARGETIVHQGSPGNVLYIIARGQVRIYRISEEGQELSVSILRTGDFFGELSLLDGEPRSASVEAMVATNTLVLHREAFRAIVQRHPEIAIAVLETISARFRGLTRYAESLASAPAPRRVVYRLIDLANSCGEAAGTTVHLSLTQDDLASLSGTTRETVNRVLSSLRDQGLVRVERARLAINDLPGLERALAQW